MTRKDLNNTGFFNKNTLNRVERLKSEKVITQLFEKSHVVTFLCLRCHWITLEEQDFPVKFSVSVSKKNFKTAIQRNKIKRAVREAYRIQKFPLYEACQKTQKKVAFMLIYIGKEILPPAEISKSIHHILEKIIKKIDAPIAQ